MPKPKRPPPSPLHIIVDTREQCPYSFEYASGEPFAVERRKLPAGDYSLAGYESRIAIERKSHVDAYGSLGKSRARFKREILKLATYDYAAIIIECSLRSFLEQPPRCMLRPQAAISSLISWDIRFGVRVVFAGSRDLAEAYTFRILQKYLKACDNSVKG